MNTTKVVNIKTHKPTLDDVYIGRGSKWGNPFTHLDIKTLAKYKVDTRKQSIEKYEIWLNNEGSYLLKDLNELYGKNLVCFCKPKPCHGDILIKLINNKFSNKLF